MTIIEPEFGAVFDADNHYWESSDSFTRHRDPKFADRGVVLKQVDGKPRYFFGERAHPIIPAPGMSTRGRCPGALYDYFSGKSSKERVGNGSRARTPPHTPNGSTATPRLSCMDAQGVEAAWLFPSQGVCMEGPMQPDIEAVDRGASSVQPLARGGLGLRVPGPDLRRPLPDVVRSRPGRFRARVVSRPRRSGSSRSATVPSSRPRARRSPADPVFDPFWARAQRRASS